MNQLDSDKQWIKEAPTDRLQEAMCQVEFDRMQAAHDKNTSRQMYLELILDAMCGELLRRDKSVRDGSEPRWDIPQAPATFYQLMALGDGSMG